LSVKSRIYFKIEGGNMAKVWKFGDDIDTDIIIAARYLNTSDAAVLATHIMEDADKDFSSKIARGDIIVAGKNFGCGSSREHAPTAHAEILALRAAGTALGDSQLEGCSLVVTLEPCTMCAGAIRLARVVRVVFAAWEPRTGACGSVRDVLRDPRANHRVEVVSGLRERESEALLRRFFVERR